MDSYEATKLVFSRVQSLDPENASKVMGYLLIQDHGEKELIRLAFGPEALLHSLIFNAKTQLGILHSKPSIATSIAPITNQTSTFNPISRPNPLSLPNPSSPSSTLWSRTNPMSPSSIPSPSYANIVTKNSSPGPVSGLSSPYTSSSREFIDNHQSQGNLSFLGDPKTDDLFDENIYNNNSSPQKQSYSVFGPEDLNSGVGWKPCLYYSRGFCKNGSSCRFLHSGSIGNESASTNVGSHNNVNVLGQCQELLRSNAAAQQQKIAAVSQFIAGGASFPYNKSMNFLMQQQNESPRPSPRSAAAALMMGDELHKFGRYQHERNDISNLNLGGNVHHSSRQIYLTFPADSTFREEDVSNYFSIYGPVQDVRIPYQQKRMFGFVTFVYSETVKIILAKGNPHFVCDSRVLVKPYKEKGKIPDKKILERGDYHLCSSLSGIDSRESYDLSLESRMLYNSQEVLLRRKIEEQANLQQAIELQERRLMNLQLLGIKRNNHHQYYHRLSEVSPIPSPSSSHTPKDQPFIVSPKENEVPEEYEAEKLQQEVNPGFNLSNHGNEDHSGNEFDLHESGMEHILPDNLFASPKKSSAGNNIDVFSTSASAKVNTESTTVTTISSNNNNSNSNSTLLPTISSTNATSPKSVLSKCPGFHLGMEPLECN